jgi:hypothetical protein
MAGKRTGRRHDFRRSGAVGAAAYRPDRRERGAAARRGARAGSAALAGSSGAISCAESWRQRPSGSSPSLMCTIVAECDADARAVCGSAVLPKIIECF